MSAPIRAAEPVVSCFAQDSGLADLVAIYAAEMPQRIEALESRFAARDWSGLTTCAHQLKGSAGSHGYHQLTPYATALERAARQVADEAEILAQLEALVAICRRVR